jgi:hypothetical protein
MNFFENIEEVLTILATNTQRSASLANNFKQVAVDQSSMRYEILMYFNILMKLFYH